MRQWGYSSTVYPHKCLGSAAEYGRVPGPSEEIAWRVGREQELPSPCPPLSLLPASPTPSSLPSPVSLEPGATAPPAVLTLHCVLPDRTHLHPETTLPSLAYVS